MGVSSGKPAIDVERASVSASLPSTMIPMSALVPPMSKVISFLRSASPPIQAPASTPAANPESSVSVGFSDTMLAVATPPFDAMILRSAESPVLLSDRSRWLIYVRTFGPMKAANAAVVKSFEFPKLRGYEGGCCDKGLREECRRRSPWRGSSCAGLR